MFINFNVMRVYKLIYTNKETSGAVFDRHVIVFLVGRIRKKSPRYRNVLTSWRKWEICAKALFLYSARFISIIYLCRLIVLAASDGRLRLVWAGIMSIIVHVCVSNWHNELRTHRRWIINKLLWYYFTWFHFSLPICYVVKVIWLSKGGVSGGFTKWHVYCKK